MGNDFGSGSFFTANDIRGLYFDITNPVILNSVDVFANTSGNRTIEVLDAQGNTYIDTTIYIPASGTNTTTVNLNFHLYPGSNYFIKCRGFVDLYRNSSGAIYPYNSTSINITGSNAGTPGYYYFFYNWQYTDITCNTGRTPAVALDTCSIGIEEQELQNSMELFPNPSHGIFHLTFNAKSSNSYLVNITNDLGAIVYRSTTNMFTGKVDKEIDLSELAKGIYMINISDGKAVVSKRITLN